VVLRDDKSFPFILIARDHAVPQISSIAARAAAKAIISVRLPRPARSAAPSTLCKRAFLLRSCSDAYFESRLRPCLLYQIKRCSAPCTGEISVEDYGRLVDEALAFLTGESDEVKRRLHALMDEASLKQDYERAASFRDRLTALSHIQSRQGINPHSVKEADVFAPTKRPGQTCIQVFHLPHRQQLGQSCLFPARGQKPLGRGGARVVRRPVL
jgi:excinuclease ABC subunit C